MNPRTLAGHLRRYPWWYGIAALWLTAILALPIVHLDALAGFSRDDPAAAPVQTTMASTAPGATPTFGGTAAPVGGAGGGPGTTTAGGTATAPTTATTKPGSLELVPPELLDLVFDAIPAFVFPPLPDELAPITAALAPIAATGCSGLGLAGIVVAVAAQSANGVPVQRILPYLAPLSAACASFPIPKKHTVCAVDVPFVTDLGGLTSTPPILGLGIDEIDQTEQLLASTFGQTLPPLADQLRKQFDCTFA